jgi:adenylate kinase family enzyme
MLHTVIFIGRSGCGKGTQADLLKDRIHKFDHEKRQILYIETGKDFRDFIKENGYSSSLSREIYERDERQPDFLGAYMWSNTLIKELEGDMHLVFDGVGRSKNEAAMLETALKFYKRDNPTVIYMNVSRKWSEERLLARHRADDANLSKIDKRLDWFDRDTLPSIEFFKSNPYFRFIEVNGEQPIEKVQADIIRAYDYES